MFDKFAEGERIAWWSDSDGRGVEPGDPNGMRIVGTIVSVHRNPKDDAHIVAYSVECATKIGRYMAVVRPDYGHHPVPATD